MKVVAIIPTLSKNHEYLKLCVESLRATVDWDIIVVSNGTSENPSYLYKNIKGITKHLHTRDQGQCQATNIGAQGVNADYLMISNDDMYYAPGWNKNLRFDYPVFSPNLVEPINNAGSAPPFLKYDGGLTIEEFKEPVGKWATKETKLDAFIKAVTRVTPTIKGTLSMSDNTVIENGEKEETGFNLPFFIKKDFWDFLGGYDVKFDPFGSNSDTDLQTRINLAGVTPMRLRDVLVYHFSNKSGTFAPENNEFYQRNFKIFYDKFGFDRDELKSDVWLNKDMIPTDPEKIKYKQEKYAGL